MTAEEINAQIFPEDHLVNSQKVFINELNSLKQDRYIEVFAHYGQTLWLVKLRHLTNGRTLVLRCYAQWGSLTENGKLLKEWPSDTVPF